MITAVFGCAPATVASLGAENLRARMLSIAGVVVRHVKRLGIWFEGSATRREFLEHGLSRLGSMA